MSKYVHIDISWKHCVIRCRLNDLYDAQKRHTLVITEVGSAVALDRAGLKPDYIIDLLGQAVWALCLLNL